MFYLIKLAGEELERFNHPASETKTHAERIQENDEAALARAKELKADEVVTSDGRKVL